MICQIKVVDGRFKEAIRRVKLREKKDKSTTSEKQRNEMSSLTKMKLTERPKRNSGATERNGRSGDGTESIGAETGRVEERVCEPGARPFSMIQAEEDESGEA